MGIAEKDDEYLRYRIIAEGLKLTAAQGLDVSTERIAEAAGASSEDLARHFSGREALNAAILVRPSRSSKSTSKRCPHQRNATTSARGSTK